MATKKQKERKKKARELKGEARVAARRHKMSLIKKEERRSVVLNAKFREKINPIVKNPEAKKRMEEVESKKALQRLEKNAQILKALEEEYLNDKERKRQLNDHLESEGHHTLKEKLDALEGKARDSMDEGQAESGQIDLTIENTK